MENAATIIAIGDELLIGQVVNSNAAWIAERLSEKGIEVAEHRTVGDAEKAIANAVRRAMDQSSTVIITGGLGPTKDDRTKKVLAALFSMNMVFDSELYENLKQYFEKLGRRATDSHRRQCFMPDRAIQLPNKMGTAPGLLFSEKDHQVFCLPGVPYEMRYLLDNEVLPRLEGATARRAVKKKTILTIGKGESEISEMIEDLEEDLPEHVHLAYLPNLAKVRLRLTVFADEPAMAEKELDAWTQKIVHRLGDLVFGYNLDQLEKKVLDLLREKELMLSTAESCTGGSIASVLTRIPGASEAFTGGIVAYSNGIKEHFLEVPREILLRHGAVSEATVRAMVNGALDRFQSDVAVAVSGIAGPGGGTAQKPVGLIWMACGNSDQVVTKKLQLSKDRSLNIQFTTMTALNLVRRFLMDL